MDDLALLHHRQVAASFLEIYGEDIYDLLDASEDGPVKRASLPVREDASGVMVVGLKQVRCEGRGVMAGLGSVCSPRREGLRGGGGSCGRR